MRYYIATVWYTFAGDISMQIMRLQAYDPMDFIVRVQESFKGSNSQFLDIGPISLSKEQ